MNTKLSEVSLGSTEDLILSVIERGARLRLDDGQLNYKAPIGAICPEQINKVQASRHQILKILGEISTPRSSVTHTPHLRVDYAPLAPSQLVHWNFHRLGVRRSVRTGAIALRLTGVLEIGALEAAVAKIIERHEALRTNIVAIGGSPVQVIHGSVRSEMTLCDLTVVPRSARELELQRIFWIDAFESIDVTKDPLFAAIIVRVDHDKHVLIVSLDHMISDGMSTAILLQDILEAYESEVSHREPSFPGISMQFADYAGWQRRMYELWSDKNDHHWNNHISGCRPLMITSDAVCGSSGRSGISFAPIYMGYDLREELLQWSQAKKTTMVMTVFTAFVALVLRWYRASEGVIQYQTAGRSMAEVQNTIGYFAFRLCMRLCMSEGDTLVDLMGRVKAEYVAACEDAELSSMDVYERTPEVARSPCFNWIPQGQIRNEPECYERKHDLRCSRIHFESQLTYLDDFEADTNLTVLLRDMGDKIQGSVQFPTGVMSFDSAERFGRNVVAFVRALVSGSNEQVTRIELVK